MVCVFVMFTFGIPIKCNRYYFYNTNKNKIFYRNIESKTINITNIKPVY